MDTKRKVTLTTIIAASLTVIFVVAYAMGALAGSADISEEEAMRIAEEETGGTATKITMEKEGFKVLYEVNVKTDKGPAEVEIDAETGEVVEVEWGEDDD